MEPGRATAWVVSFVGIVTAIRGGVLDGGWAAIVPTALAIGALAEGARLGAEGRMPLPAIATAAILVAVAHVASPVPLDGLGGWLAFGTLVIALRSRFPDDVDGGTPSADVA